MFRLCVFAAVFIAIGEVTPIQAQASAPMLEVAGPTWYSDGELRGAAAGFPVKANQPIEVYQASGRTLCASASAVRAVPADAGYGWYLRITPIDVTGPVVIDVEWERRWDRGATATNGSRGRSRITLKPGDKVVLDYLSSPAADAKCGALGMGLQVGYPAPAWDSARAPLFESQLWFVRSSDNTTLDRVTLRSPFGQRTDFVFKDMTVGFVDQRVSTASKLPRVERTVRALGRIVLQNVEGGRAVVELELSLHGAGASGARVNGGGHTLQVQVKIGEVVEVRIPHLGDDEGRLAEGLVLRLQIQPIGK
jgi:hypothetical protein